MSDPITLITPPQNAAIDIAIAQLSQDLEFLVVNPIAFDEALASIDAGLGEEAQAMLEAIQAGELTRGAALQTALFERLTILSPQTFIRFQSPKKVRESLKRHFRGATPAPAGVPATIIPSDRGPKSREIRLREKNLSAKWGAPVAIIRFDADVRPDKLYRLVFVALPPKSLQPYELRLALITEKSGSTKDLLLDDEIMIGEGEGSFLKGDRAVFAVKVVNDGYQYLRYGRTINGQPFKDILTGIAFFMGKSVFVSLIPQPELKPEKISLSNIFDVINPLRLAGIFLKKISNGQKINYALVATAEGQITLRVDTENRDHAVMVDSGDEVIAAGKMWKSVTVRGNYAFIIDGDNREFPTDGNALARGRQFLNEQIISAMRLSLVFLTAEEWSTSPLNPALIKEHP